MSSTSIIAEHSPEGHSKRTCSRHRIETLVYVDLGPGNGGFPINVSEAGMAFQGIQLLQTGQPIWVKFKLPGTGEQVQAAGKISWLNELGKGGGLQFIDLADESRQRIHRWLGLQPQPDPEPDIVPVKFRRASIPLAPHLSEDKTVAKNGLAPSKPLQSLSIVSHSPTGVRASGNTGILVSASNARAPFQEVVNTSVSIKPFAIGLTLLAAIGIGVLSSLDVIPMRFHRPVAITDHVLAQLVPDSGPPNIVENLAEKQIDSGTVLGHSTSADFPVTQPNVSSGESMPQSFQFTEPLPAGSAKSQRMKSSLTKSLRTAASGRLIAPRLSILSNPFDFVPPPFALSLPYELAPQAPAASMRSPAPVPTQGALAR